MDPILIVVGGLGIVGLLIAALVVSRRPNKVKLEGASQIDELLRKGDYVQAGSIAMQRGRAKEAIDYFLRAQQPLRAAQAAARDGDARQAAELYERGGDLERAAHFYEQAGLKQNAVELRERAKPAAKTSLAPPATGELHAAEARYRNARADSKDEVADRGRLQALATEAAEALLAAGQLRRAADVYRDAGLDDEAIHLYVNVLGAPGEAAPLVAARGHHDRAAELYELAGSKERAAAAWVSAAKGAQHPESYVDRIERLSRQIALAFLKDVTAERPLSKETMGLHLRLADVLGRSGEKEAAMAVLVQVRERVGGGDVEARIAALEKMRAASELPPAASPPRMKPAESIALSPEDVAAIAKAAAKAALEQAKRAAAPAGRRIAKGLRRPVATTVAGLERAPISKDLIDDDVLLARDGPSIETLRKMIKGRGCDLQNIEVYYRLGLAHVAAGEWIEAIAAFDAVEEASPGYRDADRRSAEIRTWQSAIAPKREIVGQSVVISEKPQETRYAIRGELGRGGMAVVYRATDEVLGRDVALKFLTEQTSAREDLRAMFAREARSVAQLNHPNIVTLYDFGVLDGRAFIAMEYVDGVTVDQMMRERGRLTVVESLRLVTQVLAALEYAHARGIVHRDIKPSNMMRTSSGLVKLMDFGLAKTMSPGGAKSSIVAGTPAYMPSEQYLGTEVDQRADLFSVGVSLYEMLTGELPFKHLDRSKPPASPSSIEATIPIALDALVLKAIEDDRERRFTSAAELSAPMLQILDAVDKLSPS